MCTIAAGKIRTLQVYEDVIILYRLFCEKFSDLTDIQIYGILYGPIRKTTLTLKHRETHGCVVSTVATDALVLKHQAISILSTD